MMSMEMHETFCDFYPQHRLKKCQVICQRVQFPFTFRMRLILQPEKCNANDKEKKLFTPKLSGALQVSSKHYCIVRAIY